MAKEKTQEKLYRVKRELTSLGATQIIWSKIVSASSASKAVQVSLTKDEKEWTGKPKVPTSPDVAVLQPPKQIRKVGMLARVRSERLLPWEVRAYSNRVMKSKKLNGRKARRNNGKEKTRG